MNPLYIETTNQLKELCSHIEETASLVAIDTEFARESTYFPILSTIQIATHDRLALVDALATDLSLDPLRQLFQNKAVTKVFHAARQDLEIFYHLWQELPTPIADTQITAMVAGYGDSIGYGSLIQSLFHVSLNKDSRTSDWLQRPLSKTQISYALGDVKYLIEAYTVLLKKASHKISWSEEELDKIKDPKLYQPNPNDIWRRLKIPPGIPETHFKRAAKLSKWREEIAIRDNKPRHHVLKDPSLWDIARNKNPKSKARLIMGQKKSSQKYEHSLLAALSSTDEGPDLPPQKEVRTPNPLILDALKLLHRVFSEKHQVAPKLLCPLSDLKKIAVGERSDLPVLEGWRFDLFGKPLLDFLEGKSKIGIKDLH